MIESRKGDIISIAKGFKKLILTWAFKRISDFSGVNKVIDAIIYRLSPSI